MSVEITKDDVGKWFVHRNRTIHPEFFLVQIVAILDCETAVGVFADGAGNEFWSSGVFDLNGIERGPTEGFIERKAIEQEIKDYT